MEKIIQEHRDIEAWQCANFTEYDEFELNENPNLSFGDGECPAYHHVIHNNYSCSTDCKHYEELK